MPDFGNENAGFSVSGGLGQVVVRAWGFWTPVVSEQFAPAIRAELARNPKGIALIVDAKELRPLREEGQRAFAEVLSHCMALGTSKVVFRGPSALTKLQLMRLIQAEGNPRKVQVEE